MLIKQTIEIQLSKDCKKELRDIITQYSLGYRAKNIPIQPELIAIDKKIYSLDSKLSKREAAVLTSILFQHFIFLVKNDLNISWDSCFIQLYQSLIKKTGQKNDEIARLSTFIDL